MSQFINQLRDTSKYSSRTDILKINFMYGVLVLIAIMISSIGTVGTVTGADGTPQLPLIALAFTGIVYGLVRSGQLRAGSWILLIALSTLITLANIPAGILPPQQIANAAMLIILGGFLLETQGLVVFSSFAVLQALLFPEISGFDNNGLYDWPVRIALAVIYLLVASIVYAYNQFIVASRLTGQDLESVERLKLAEVNARITRQASARESLDTALNSTLQLILENYPEIYHAQVFLIDDDGIQARLVASTGEAGGKLIERRHSLAVGSVSVIGQTTFKGDPVIAVSGSTDGVHRANELLPDTKLEAAFPLRVGEQIIGALDLQSRVLERLDDNDRLTFQSLANSLSLAIDSIRQFEQAQARVEENQRLAEQTRSALREVERLNQRLIGRAWSEYVKGLDDDLGYAVNFEQDHTTEYHQWTNSLSEAVKFNNLVQEGNVIAVPLRVRGQVIGAMEFELNENQDFSPEDLELITEVSERFGLAAENTRLVEESQRTAQRETLINQITSRFQSAQNVEATLTEAARSLSETLSADHVKIRLGVPDTSNGKGK